MEKIIHQIWVGPYRIPKRELSYIDMMRSINSDYKYILWTDEEVKSLIMPENIKTSYDYFYKKSDFVAAADVVRLFLVYEFGGIYLDIDFKPISRISQIFPEKEFDAFICYHHDCGPFPNTLPNNIFGSKKNGKLFTWIINNIKASYEQSPGVDIVNWLVPCEFANLIKTYLSLDLNKTQIWGKNGLLESFEKNNIFYYSYIEFHENICYHQALYSHSPENKIKFKNNDYE